MEKEQFTAYRDLHREVRQLKRQLENMENMMFSPSGQRFTSVPYASHGRGNTMDRMVAAHIELQETIDEKVLELTTAMIELEKAVEAIDVPLERHIMRRRYFDGWNWEQICEELHYSRQQVYRYHGYALAKLREYPEAPPEAEGPVVVDDYTYYEEDIDRENEDFEN